MFVSGTSRGSQFFAHMGLFNHVLASVPLLVSINGSYSASLEKVAPILNSALFLQTKEDMLRWIARCLLLHGVAPCELMGDTERSLHISLLFDLPWQADLAALATPTSPAVLSGGTSLGKWNFSFCPGGGTNSPIRPSLVCHVLAKAHPNRL
jgi:hypothetical protein